MSTKDQASRRKEGVVLLERTGAIATITLSRPEALNAMTWTMYEQLEAHMVRLECDKSIRVVIIRGAGKAFASGTDISQFQGFTVEDGLTYERKMEAIFEQIYTFPKPIIAAIHGYAVGAGSLLASVSDLRYASPSSRFGVPTAQTMGNALSLKNYRHLVNAFGAMRVREMLFTARLLTSQEALQCGFLTAIVEEERLFAQVAEIARQVSMLAPLTLWAAKEAQRRIRVEEDKHIPFDDVLTRIYASNDFAEGVRAYIEKRKPHWQGQ